MTRNKIRTFSVLFSLQTVKISCNFVSDPTNNKLVEKNDVSHLNNFIN